tara:strand:- start:60428 stop:61861 length:1434 start_codon:yes stop_codon:yes gene_type:complete
MVANFALDPALREQTYAPAPYFQTFEGIDPITIGTIASGLDDLSGYTITWDLDGDGQYDDLSQSTVGISTALSREQIATLGWNQSGQYHVSALVNGGTSGSVEIDDIITINSAPIGGPDFGPYFYTSRPNTFDYFDPDGDRLIFSNLKVISIDTSFVAGPLTYTADDHSISFSMTGTYYVDPVQYNDPDYYPYDPNYGNIVFSFTVSDGKSAYTDYAAFEVRPEVVPGLTTLNIATNGSGETATLFLAENMAHVTTVAADADSAQYAVRYSVSGGADAALFHVDAVTGALDFLAAPDFETPMDANRDGRYDVEVKATAGPLFDTQVISVSVYDVLEGTHSGTGGADVLTAPDGSGWSLFGYGGADTLIGGMGQDILVGGNGKDWLTGGAGSDIFVFAAGESKAGGGVRDVITDFQVNVDKLDVSALAITNFAEQVTFKTVGSGLIVYVDTNHNGFDYSDFGVQLSGVHALGQSDFVL